MLWCGCVYAHVVYLFVFVCLYMSVYASMRV
jgi:hypothetical protein